MAAGDNDKSASSTNTTVHHKKPKKGWSDTVHENAGNPFFGTAPAYEYEGPACGLDNQTNGQAYCMRRFRSYDAGTGMYLGFDGERHPCP